MTITLTREEAQQVLDALGNAYINLPLTETLRARLSAPEPEPLIDGWPLYSGLPQPEPVAWVEKDGELIWQNYKAAIGRNLYIAPPQRPWQGLTMDELSMISDRMKTWNSISLIDVYRDIETKLRGKNK